MNTSFAIPPPRVHAIGSTGLLFDAAHGAFDAVLQQRIWAVVEALSSSDAPAGISEAVPGVNNLMVVVDPLRCHPREAADRVLALWALAVPGARAGRDIEVPVVYGGAEGEDLADIARDTGLGIDAVVRMHSSAVYAVNCIGAMPGFAYLSGLPEALARPRRAVPRTHVRRGAVIVGGAQAGIMPCNAPSGWHVLGHTTLEMFDAQRPAPCLLAPGDRVHFQVKDIAA